MAAGAGACRLGAPAARSADPLLHGVEGRRTRPRRVRVGGGQSWSSRLFPYPPKMVAALKVGSKLSVPASTRQRHDSHTLPKKVNVAELPVLSGA